MLDSPELGLLSGYIFGAIKSANFVTTQLVRLNTTWIPAFAGMTDPEKASKTSHSREGGNPGHACHKILKVNLSQL